MNYALYITVDKDLKRDYCHITSSGFSDENIIYLNVYTNGKEKIDFKKMTYLAYNEELYNDYANHFSYGKNVFKNVKMVYISAARDKNSEIFKDKNSKSDNRLIMKVMNNNKRLLNKMVYVDVGSISLNKEDIESLKPFKKYKNVLVTFDDTAMYHPIEELENMYEVTNELVIRTIKHDFTPIEQMLYAYDLIRTNFAGSKTYEEKMNKILDLYNDPSFCYSYIYKKVLDRLGIKNALASGVFYYDETRAFNIAHVKDETYNIDGIYYFDIANNSKQRFDNSLLDTPAENGFKDQVINNHLFFCKTKWLMTERGSLDHDYRFGDFDEDYVSVYDYMLKKEGINGVFKLRQVLNSVGQFIDGKNVIDSSKGIQTDEELADIRSDTERYAELFGKAIDAEDFLEILFNVRKEQYIENKALFPLTLEDLRMCMYQCHFAFSNMVPEFSEEQEYEQEDIDETLLESFENNFEESVNNAKIEERIKQLKLTLNKESEKPNKEDNN